jgi:molecular chaperone Hsp33
MNKNPETTLTVGTNTDNVIQNFQLDNSSLRGRMVRLGSELDDIIQAHDYPEVVNQLLSETLALAVTLASMLKYDGIFTLQIQTKGPISMLVADKTSEGHIRACATYDTDALEALLKKAAAKKRNPLKLPLAEILGSGYMAFTVDQGSDTERYQGIVELKGGSLVESVQHYFNQSEQIGSGIKMACGKVGDVWRSSVIMLQHMPEDENNAEAASGNFIEDDWRRTMILLGSCKNEELISAELDSQELLYRLFHEEQLRVFEPKFVKKQCRCERDRLVRTIRMMPQEDQDHIFKGDTAIVKCEFCSKDYTIKHDEF